MIKLKSGHEVTIRALLKSLPASHGMHRPQLFQFIEPNSSGAVIIATYQESDKAFIDKQKETIESKIHHLIVTREENKLFINDIDGMWFGSILKKNRQGRIFTSAQPNKAAIE
jgi:hypothetical protein